MSRSAIKRTLATQNAAFEALGLSKSVASAIAFPEPTKIQELGIPAMLNEKMDVVVASETGSGKTLTYLAPLVSSLLENPKPKNVLIFCPNQMLCTQVCQVADKLIRESSEGKDGKDLTDIMVEFIGSDSSRIHDYVSSGSKPASVLVVTTPSAFVRYFPSAYDTTSLQKMFLKRVGNVVFDEADSIVAGGMTGEFRKIMATFAYGDFNSGKGACSFSRNNTGKFLGRLNTKMKKNGHKPRLIMVGATMPRTAQNSCGAILENGLGEDATWVGGDFLHQLNPQVTFDWREEVEPPREFYERDHKNQPMPLDGNLFTTNCMIS
jgi:superfamily II DNA/RNA helicase